MEVRRSLVVNSTPLETRIALLENGQICELFIERTRSVTSFRVMGCSAARRRSAPRMSAKAGTDVLLSPPPGRSGSMSDG